VGLVAGYNVVGPPSGATAGAIPLLSALFYNDGRGEDAALAGGPGQARAAATLQGRDGRTYRIVRTLGGTGVLHRLDPGRVWTQLSQDTSEINQLLRTALGLPTKTQFHEIFCFTRESLPSNRPVQPARAPSPSPKGGERKIRPNALVEAAMAAAAKPNGAIDSTRARQDLERLRAEIASGQELEELQFKLEGLQQRLFKGGERLKEVETLAEQLEPAKSALSSHRSLESLGLAPDLLARAAKYDDALRRRDEAIEKLQRDGSGAQPIPIPASPRAFWLNPHFLGGVTAGVAALAAGLFFRRTPLGYLAFLEIPAFGYSALWALKWVGELQGSESLARKQALVSDRLSKLEAAFESDFGKISEALKTLELKSGRELIELFERQEDQAEAVRALEARLAQAQADPELITARTETEKLASEAKALEEKIARLGAGATRDWHEAEREARGIEQALAGGQPSGPVSPSRSEPPASSSAESPQLKAPRQEDPTPRLLSQALDLLPGTALEGLAKPVGERAAQHLAVLSEGRGSGLAIDGRGHASVKRQGGAVVPAGELDANQRDLVYLSVRLALLERLAPATKMLVALDDPFAGLPEKTQQLLCRTLKQLGKLTQVVHASSQPASKSLADAAHSG
jgi:hypothetical protein